MKRRRFLATTAALGVGVSLPRVQATTVTALSPTLAKLVKSYTKGVEAAVGRVKFDIAPLVENGNSVPVEVTVESPMTDRDHVTGIAIYNEKNPQNDVAVFFLSPAMGRARVATRIRLAMSQQLVAVALMSDGRAFMEAKDVLVTLASCLEDD
jgi:sulfur-oxidizing protein SoxY